MPTPTETAPDIEAISRAEEYAGQGFEAYQRRDYERSVLLYRKAFDVVPAADILFNIARIYETGLRDRSLAIAFYRRYIAHPGAIPDRIQVANERLSLLRNADPEAAPTREMARATTDVDGSLNGAAGNDSGGLRTMRIAGLSLGGLGAIGVGAGIIFGVLAISDRDAAREVCEGRRCEDQGGIDAMNSAFTKATLSTWSYAIGAALVGAGAALWFLDDENADGGSRARASLRFSPTAGPSQVGARLLGRW